MCPITKIYMVSPSIIFCFNWAATLLLTSIFFAFVIVFVLNLSEP